MTTRKIFSIIFILSLITLISCDKDDDKSRTESVISFGAGFVSGEQRSSFEMIRDGVKGSCVGEKVCGWQKGQLLVQTILIN